MKDYNKNKSSIYFQKENRSRLEKEAVKLKRTTNDTLNRIIDFYFEAEDLATVNPKMTAQQLIKELRG